MSYAIQSRDGRQVESRAVINQSSILSASEEAVRDIEVGASAVDKFSSSNFVAEKRLPRHATACLQQRN